jgi:hypothetical protein
MKSKSRRYEVLLPVRFNDGTDVPEELLAEAVNEIVEQFNAGCHAFAARCDRLLLPDLPAAKAWRPADSHRAMNDEDRNTRR